MKLLIVEDDPSVIENYKKEIQAYNEDRKINHQKDISIQATIIKKKDKALIAIRNTQNSFDAAIVDLNLLGIGHEDSSGNDVIREIKKSLRFPVFVITGTPTHLDDNIKGDSCLFKLITRGEEDDYLEQLVAIYNTGITKILNKTGDIERYITEIFWNHISNSLDLWIKDETRSFEKKQKSLLRYTLLHIQEYLDINSAGGLEKYHPAEFLITKPVKPNMFTGDILEDESCNRYVILTPACDIDLKNNIRKAEKILTLKIIEPKDIDAEYSNKNMSNTKMNKLKPILSNSIPRYHFIPRIGGFNNGVIDFQDKKLFDVEELTNLITSNSIKRIATISSPFLKDIIARYSNYYSRQGSPDFNQEELLKSLF